MTLPAFQRALCDLIASPRLCMELRTDPKSVLTRYELSSRERLRLTDIVWQRGMSTNCSLYRSNRITPIYTLLNFTCLVLGDTLEKIAESFWDAKEFSDAQFLNEVEKFGLFLKRKICAGDIDNPVLEEVLDFELAANALEFSSRRQILADIAGREIADPNGPGRLHPLARVVRFRHDPDVILRALASQQLPMPSLPEGDFFLILSVLSGRLEAIRIAPAIGRALLRVESAGSVAVSPDLAPELFETGLLLPV